MKRTGLIFLFCSLFMLTNLARSQTYYYFVSVEVVKKNDIFYTMEYYSNVFGSTKNVRSDLGYSDDWEDFRKKAIRQASDALEIEFQGTALKVGHYLDRMLYGPFASLQEANRYRTKSMADYIRLHELAHKTAKTFIFSYSDEE